MFGGWGRNRTGVKTGFAIRRMTILPPNLEIRRASNEALRNLERETRFELATPTLARLCSTTELFPRCCVARIIAAFLWWSSGVLWFFSSFCRFFLILLFLREFWLKWATAKARITSPVLYNPALERSMLCHANPVSAQ